MNPLQQTVQKLQKDLNQTRQTEHFYEYVCKINDEIVNIIQRPKDGDQMFKELHQHLWGYISLLNLDVCSHRYLELNKRQYKKMNQFIQTIEHMDRAQLIQNIQQIANQ